MSRHIYCDLLGAVFIAMPYVKITVYLLAVYILSLFLSSEYGKSGLLFFCENTELASVAF